jgi:hypothetical protein
MYVVSCYYLKGKYHIKSGFVFFLGHHTNEKYILHCNFFFNSVSVSYRPGFFLRGGHTSSFNIFTAIINANAEIIFTFFTVDYILIGSYCINYRVKQHTEYVRKCLKNGQYLLESEQFSLF